MQKMIGIRQLENLSSTAMFTWLEGNPESVWQIVAAEAEGVPFPVLVARAPSESPRRWQSRAVLGYVQPLSLSTVDRARTPK